MIKYKTISLSYGNGESELINGMAKYNWGLVNVQKPDHARGDIEHYYTFAGGDNAVDVDFHFYSNPKFTEIPTKKQGILSYTYRNIWDWLSGNKTMEYKEL